MNQGIKLYKTYDVKKISDCHQSIGPKTNNKIAISKKSITNYMYIFIIRDFT